MRSVLNKAWEAELDTGVTKEELTALNKNLAEYKACTAAHLIAAGKQDPDILKNAKDSKGKPIHTLNLSLTNTDDMNEIVKLLKDTSIELLSFEDELSDSNALKFTKAIKDMRLHSVNKIFVLKSNISERALGVLVHHAHPANVTIFRKVDDAISDLPCAMALCDQYKAIFPESTLARIPLQNQSKIFLLYKIGTELTYDKRRLLFLTTVAAGATFCLYLQQASPIAFAPLALIFVPIIIKCSLDIYKNITLSIPKEIERAA